MAVGYLDTQAPCYSVKRLKYLSIIVDIHAARFDLFQELPDLGHDRRIDGIHKVDSQQDADPTVLQGA
jgi:hypothetical protein